jgi:hypothetical protein
MAPINPFAPKAFINVPIPCPLRSFVVIFVLGLEAPYTITTVPGLERPSFSTHNPLMMG